MASCWVSELPPWTTSFRAGVLNERPERAEDVDAEMFEEAAVLRRHRRLDEVIGDLLKRNGIRELDAALSDLIPIAIEERDAEFASRAPIGVLGEFDGGKFEHQHHGGASRAKRQHIRQNLGRKPPETGHAEAVEEIVVVCPPVFKSGVQTVEGGVDPRSSSASQLTM